MAWLDNKVHVGLVAADGPAMVAFYRDVLAIPYGGSVPFNDRMLTHYFDVGDVRIKVAVMDPPLDHHALPGGWDTSTGMRWLTLDTDDLDGVVDRCAAAGATFAAERQESAIKPGLLYAIVCDPDGNWVELVQRP